MENSQKQSKLSPEEIQRRLGGFTGTENYYKFHTLKLTDGVKWLAEVCECYWLLDIIFSIARFERKLRGQEFVVCKIRVIRLAHSTKAVFTADDGNNNILYRQNIPFTDFPLDEIKLYLVDGVILLPSEY